MAVEVIHNFPNWPSIFETIRLFMGLFQTKRIRKGYNIRYIAENDRNWWKHRCNCEYVQHETSIMLLIMSKLVNYFFMILTILKKYVFKIWTHESATMKFAFAFKILSELTMENRPEVNSSELFSNLQDLLISLMMNINNSVCSVVGWID